MFYKWIDIQALHNTIHSVKRHVTRNPFPVINYNSKVKLHGTNAAVNVNFATGEVSAQDRSRLIVPSNDNMGFAAWVDQNKKYFSSLGNDQDQNITIYGEWCGPGIQNGVALNKCDTKMFVVFALVERENSTMKDYGDWVNVDPMMINILLGDILQRPSTLHILPWYQENIVLDLSKDLSEIVESMNESVTSVEDCDPWVKEVFGIEGTGEGLVYYPRGVSWVGDSPTKIGGMNRDLLKLLIFKAKGEKHQSQKMKAPVVLDTATLNSINEFVDMFATENRFNQAIAELFSENDEGFFLMKNVGAFLGWVNRDVKKESVSEMEANGLNWKVVSSAVTNRAKTWFFAEIDKNL